MGADTDIWRAANLLIKQHGENAALEAAMRADALLAEGQIDGQRVFLRIIDAIKWLQNTEGRHPFKVEH